MGTLARVGVELWRARSQEERVHPWHVCVGAESSRSFPDPVTPVSNPKCAPGMRGLGPPRPWEEGSLCGACLLTPVKLSEWAQNQHCPLRNLV